MLRRFAALLLCLLVLTALCVPAAAQEEEAQELRVYFDGLLSCRGYVRSGQVLIPLQAMCRLADIQLSKVQGEGLCYEGRGLKLSIFPEEGYLGANGRYLLCPGGAEEIEGRLCLPADTAARIFSCRAEINMAEGRVDIDTENLSVIRGGSDYYRQLADVEDIFWLSRILYSEAGLQGLEAMLAVGQVVFNRIEDERYPDGIFEVIFDREGGIQFTPVQDGTIYTLPSELAEIAAYMCYEGYDLVGDSLYFVNPAMGDVSWFSANKVYHCTVGLHDFYVDG